MLVVILSYLLVIEVWPHDQFHEDQEVSCEIVSAWNGMDTTTIWLPKEDTKSGNTNKHAMQEKKILLGVLRRRKLGFPRDESPK